jgi:hypothetical protein
VELAAAHQPTTFRVTVSPSAYFPCSLHYICTLVFLQVLIILYSEDEGSSPSKHQTYFNRLRIMPENTAILVLAATGTLNLTIQSITLYLSQQCLKRGGGRKWKRINNETDILIGTRDDKTKILTHFLFHTAIIACTDTTCVHPYPILINYYSTLVCISNPTLLSNCARLFSK